MRWTVLTGAQLTELRIRRVDEKARKKHERKLQKQRRRSLIQRFRDWRGDMLDRYDARWSAYRKRRIAFWTERSSQIMEWHEWFAWYPVRDLENGVGMFGEKVLRRHSWAVDNWVDYCLGWEYRPITILPKDLGMETDK